MISSSDLTHRNKPGFALTVSVSGQGRSCRASQGISLPSSELGAWSFIPSSIQTPLRLFKWHPLDHESKSGNAERQDEAFNLSQFWPGENTIGSKS